MMSKWVVLSLLLLIFAVLVGSRFIIELIFADKQEKPVIWVFRQTTGNKEIQADCVQIYQNPAGIMSVLADGIGKENTGKVAAQVAADTVLDAFEPYRVLNNPEYLFRTSFLEAHSRVQRTIGERRGGASMGAVFTNRTQLYYALVGNIKIALLRNGELIPISKGQTLSVLAKDAYGEGIISKEETIWSQDSAKVWNYLGKDGFREIEVCNPPINLKSKDMIIMISQGIYEEVSWAEIEDVLITDMTLEEKANRIVRTADLKESQNKQNGSVILLTPEV